MRLAIREMTAADAAGVARVRAQDWRHGYRGLVPPETLEGRSAPRFAARLRRQLSDRRHGHRHLVAEATSPGVPAGVVGWAHLGPYRAVTGVDADGELAGDGEIYALHVLPDLTGRGVGRALLGAALTQLAGQGHERARLWVPRDHATARRLYERAGFRPDGAEQVVRVAGAPVTQLRYVRPLCAASRPEAA